MRIGVISDTHGYLDPRAAAALQGVARILHAGDIGSPAIVDALAAIAPVDAVHGNVDTGTPLARRYPASRQVLERLKGGGFVPFVELFAAEEGKLGVVVTFMAILELVKESLIELVQNEPFAAIHVRLRPALVEDPDEPE